MMDLASIINPFLGRNPPQFGYAPGVPNSLYRATSAHVSNVYDSKVKKMPGTWDLFKTTVTAFWAVVILLLGWLCFLVWDDFSMVRGDVSTLRRDFSDARVEFTKAIGSVEKEVATTNGKLDATNAKLDSIVLELQRPRR
jgi:hypothetical protein